jgi:hypothetical protein
VDPTAGAPTSAAAPAGWYPDPTGAPAWRRWEGATWGDATIPFHNAAPGPDSMFREARAWRSLRAFLPFAVAVPAVLAAVMAAESPTYAPYRAWFRAAWTASSQGHPIPSIPAATASASPLDAMLQMAAVVLVVIGVVGWLRFSAASLRVAREAGYEHRVGAVASGLLFFVPVAGPLVAASASASCLPRGHEARRALWGGWGLVTLAEALWLGLYVAVLATPSAAVAWTAAAACAAAWVAAALVLPGALRAVAEDHATLDVRLGTAYS